MDELQVRNLGSFLHCHDKHLSYWTYHVDDLNRDVDHLVSILQLRAPVVA